MTKECSEAEIVSVRLLQLHVSRTKHAHTGCIGALLSTHSDKDVHWGRSCDTITSQRKNVRITVEGEMWSEKNTRTQKSRSWNICLCLICSGLDYAVVREPMWNTNWPYMYLFNGHSCSFYEQFISACYSKWKKCL